MIKHTQKHNWLIDLALMTGFLILFFTEFTGLSLHQWLGAGVTALALVHLFRHWDWVIAVAKRYFSKTTWRARLYLLLNASILLGMVVILETGLAISTWINLSLANYGAWVELHVYSSLVTLGLVVLKIGLHWRWITTTFRKVFAERMPSGMVQTRHRVPVSISLNQQTVNRRQFLALMGVVGTASLVAASSALSRIKTVESSALADALDTTEAKPASLQATEVQTQDYSPTSTRAATIQLTPSATEQPQLAYDNPVVSTACQVRCPRGCSFPGQCRRYVDTNQNRKCDLGECL